MHAVLVGLLTTAFLGAGLVNAVGAPAQRESFVRWGYPAWWRLVTGALEFAAAALIAFTGTRPVGLLLGAAIVVAAVATVVRRRELSHLVPLGVFAVLLGLNLCFA